MSPLETWESFYVIVGCAAGGLIGLQFVVITLIAERPRPRLGDATQAFSTPTIIHFVVVLLLSALISAPWSSIEPLAKIWGSVGLLGVVYCARIGLLMKRQQVYKPVLSDWLLFCVLPACAYFTLLIDLFVSAQHPREAVFSVGFALLVLLCTGIHNAWDTVTYHVITRQSADRKAEEAK